MSGYEKLLDDFDGNYFRSDYLYAKYARRFRESYTSIEVLYAIWEGDDGISQKKIADALFLSKQTVCAIISDLEKKGLVSHRPSPTDKRSKEHFLTENGKAHFNEAVKELRDIEMTCMKQIDMDDLVLMNETMDKFLNLFEKEIERVSNKEQA